MFDFRRICCSKSPIFSTIPITVVLLLILFAAGFINNISLHSVVYGRQKTPPQELQTPNKQQHFKAASAQKQTPLLVKKEEVEKPRDDDHGLLVPPSDLTVEARIVWFKENLPKFKIFKSTNSTRQFRSRVQGFLGDGGCGVQFFMTWISPASSFGQREFTAMESLFKAHPHGCLVILSRTMDSARGNRTLKPLRDRGLKILAVSPDLPFLFKATPAEAWFGDMKKGKKDPGKIPLGQNLSNLIRLVVLYKYGGVYLDTDFLVLKDFSGLRNTVGTQSIDGNGQWTVLNNAVLVFDKKHPILYKFIEEFSLTFNGNVWGHNGPYMLSRVVKREANKPEFNLTVLPPTAFYPVDWTQIARFFVKPGKGNPSDRVEAEVLRLSVESYAVHLWNSLSNRVRIEEGSIMARLISNHCIICNYKLDS